MKTLELLEDKTTVKELLRAATKTNVILRTQSGREFILAEVDDFDREVELVRENKELMAFLDDRSKEPGTLSLRDVRKALKS